jgi:hypothetical protein
MQSMCKSDAGDPFEMDRNNPRERPAIKGMFE